MSDAAVTNDNLCASRQSPRHRPSASSNRFLHVGRAGLACIAIGTLLVGSVGPGIYRKDLQADYLPALELRNGGDIFTPLVQLSERYFPITEPVFPHPSPHPPVLALLSLPLTCLSYPVAVVLWLGSNLVLLAVVARWLGFSVGQSFAIVAWPPMWELLNVGNFELVVLVLAMLAWKAAAAGRDRQAGVLLGLAVSIKLYPAFFLVPFVMRRRWGLVSAAGVTVVLSQIADLAIVGFSGLVVYYTKVLPAVSAFYRHSELNSSPYGALLHLFGGAFGARALLHVPGLVLPLAIAIALAALVALTNLEPEAAPVAILVALPIVWSTYAVLALPQMVRLLRCKDWRYATLLSCAAASITYPLMKLWMQALAGNALPIVGWLAIEPLGFVGLLLLSVARRLAGESLAGRRSDSRTL